jgi:hypothetical protein
LPAATAVTPKRTRFGEWPINPSLKNEAKRLRNARFNSENGGYRNETGTCTWINKSFLKQPFWASKNLYTQKFFKAKATSVVI